MSLKIPDAVSLRDGIHKAIKEQNEQILTDIQSNKSVHEKIHEVRKSLKKLRAAVRIVRKSTDRYKEENIFYRDLGREISDLRDKTAHLEALGKLRERFSNTIYQRTFNQFDKILAKDRENALKEALAQRDPLKYIEKEIREHMDAFHPFEIEGFDDILPGMQKVYKRGRKALEEAIKEPSTENFHEWRKRTKYLRYQLEMLMSAFPHMISAWEESLHDLSDYLGDDHDLSMVAECARTHRENGFTGEPERTLLHALIYAERNRLQDEALSLGRKLYFDSPKDFARRIETFWQAD